jgi:hypothetical protein
VVNDVHARGAVILLVEELFFEEKFGSQAEIEAASFGTSPVSAETFRPGKPQFFGL